jgi:hypothetical protein
MALKKKAPRSKEKTLYILHEDERLEYVKRQNFVQSTYMELQAAQLYLSSFQDFLIKAHDLPEKFNLNLNTGIVTEKEKEAEDAEDSSV